MLGWLSFRFLGLAWGAVEPTFLVTTFLAFTLDSPSSCWATGGFAFDVATCLSSVAAFVADGAPDFLYLQIAYAQVTLEAVSARVFFIENGLVFLVAF